MKKYTHLELNKEIKALSGHYIPLKEVRLEQEGREVLYVITHTVVDSSCCGTADFNHALIPGYILRWQPEKNSDGLPVSEVEPVTDKTVKDRIREAILGSENVAQIEFW
jgi:hypothetical protein